MRAKSQSVFTGFLNLNEAERKELIDEINKYINTPKPAQESYRDRTRILDSVEKGTSINFGPAPGGCPCCGK